MTTPEETAADPGVARARLVRELRGRLASVISCARALRAGGVGQDAALDRIERAARDLTDLVNDHLAGGGDKPGPAGEGRAWNR